MRVICGYNYTPSVAVVRLAAAVKWRTCDQHVEIGGLAPLNMRCLGN